MTSLEKRLCMRIFFIVLVLFLISCGSKNFHKEPAGNKEAAISDKVKISQLESQLSDIKQEQANLTLQMENKDKTLRQLHDDVVKLEEKISNLENSNKTSEAVQPKIEDTDPTVLYQKARTLLIEENYQTAATLFAEFTKDYPQHSLADNAVYWLGECYYSLRDYKKAIPLFKDLVTQYPKSEKVPDALLKTGYSYLSLDDTNRAHHYLKQVLKEYPFSQAAEKAQKKLGDFE